MEFYKSKITSGDFLIFIANGDVRLFPQFNPPDKLEILRETNGKI